MASEIAKPSTLRVKQWEACKGRILAKMQTLAEFNAKTVKEMIPDIRIIKENRLWEHGGYESFEHFCNKAIGVTKQHIYKLLQDDAETVKVLGINATESSDLTIYGQTVTPQIPAPPPPKKATPKPPMKQAKAKEISSQPNLAIHTEILPNSANVCPTCGHPMP